MERNLAEVNPNNNSHNHLPCPVNKKNSIKRQVIVIITKLTETVTEAINPIGDNLVEEDHTEEPKIGEEDSKTIIQANIKATADDLIPPTEAETIITMTITEVKVVVAMVEAIIDLAVAVEAIIKAIKITNTINITHIMMACKLTNMAHHALDVVVSTILPNIVLKENMT